MLCGWLPATFGRYQLSCPGVRTTAGVVGVPAADPVYVGASNVEASPCPIAAPHAIARPAAETISVRPLMLLPMRPSVFWNAPFDIRGVCTVFTRPVKIRYDSGPGLTARRS